MYTIQNTIQWKIFLSSCISAMYDLGVRVVDQPCAQQHINISCKFQVLQEMLLQIQDHRIVKIGKTSKITNHQDSTTTMFTIKPRPQVPYPCFFEHLQACFPGQLVLMPDNPFHGNNFSQHPIQSNPLLAQLEAISSHPITCYLRCNVRYKICYVR